MKVLTILASIVITITSCNCQKKTKETNVAENRTVFPDKSVVTSGKVAMQQIDVPTIYYEANTRGFFLAIKVENKTLSISKERDFKEYSNSKTLSDEDWAEISKLAKTVDLEKVKDLKWPTEKRYYDGAAHANIIFESNGVQYPANGFDHGFPPAEIETLVNKNSTISRTKIMTIQEIQEEIIDEFSMFDDWDERFQYVIDLGKNLPIIEEKYKTDENTIKGCQSKVWLNGEFKDDKVVFTADSDAIITKGIIAILIRVFSNQSPAAILEANTDFIDEIGLKSHLSPTRANGLVSMIKQIKMYALAFGAKQ